MLTLCSARPWQSLPSVPGRSSKRIVNSLVVGMVGTSLRCTSRMGWKGPARFQLSLESYSGDAPASRAKRNRFTVCHTQLPALTGESSPALKSEAYRLTNMQDACFSERQPVFDYCGSE